MPQANNSEVSQYYSSKSEGLEGVSATSKKNEASLSENNFTDGPQRGYNLADDHKSSKKHSSNLKGMGKERKNNMKTEDISSSRVSSRDGVISNQDIQDNKGKHDSKVSNEDSAGVKPDRIHTEKKSSSKNEHGSSKRGKSGVSPDKERKTKDKSDKANASSKSEIGNRLNNASSRHHHDSSGLPIGTERTSLTNTQREVTSFLDGLTEEDRRTRTRHLPAVDGFRKLHKSEIKQDLKLARLISQGTSKSQSKRSSSSENNSNVDSENEPSMKKTNLERNENDYSDESNPPNESHSCTSAFIAPNKSDRSSTRMPNADGSTEMTDQNKSEQSETEEMAKEQSSQSGSSSSRAGSNANLRSPQIVDTITAFNPPRPPESIGPKKKHRLLRWERNPHEIEIDIENYRKTVDRTRMELHKIENECQKLEIIGSSFRVHFMNYANMIKEEAIVVDEEYFTMRNATINLVKESDQNNNAKTGDILKKLLAIERSKGRKRKSTMISNSTPGAGGVASSPILDDTISAPASAWMLKGDRVSTPLGEGVVLDILHTTELNTSASLPMCLSAIHSNHPKSKQQKNYNQSINICIDIIPTRICIKLPYAIGFFTSSSVKTVAKPRLSAKRLIRRWNEMKKSAFECEDLPDVEMMKNQYGSSSDQSDIAFLAYYNGEDNNAHFVEEDSVPSNGISEKIEQGESFENLSETLSNANKDSANRKNIWNRKIMDNVKFSNGKGDGSVASRYNVDNLQNNNNTSNKQQNLRLIPFGSNLIPTSADRGVSLSNKTPKELEKWMENTLQNCKGITANSLNMEAPKDMREWEADRFEMYRLKAKILQLRNELFRQRRIRVVNERCFASTKERSDRAESLMYEMKDDLTALKSRLQSDLSDLGIEHVLANSLMHNMEQKYPM